MSQHETASELRKSIVVPHAGDLTSQEGNAGG